jgi:hypothetical protein
VKWNAEAIIRAGKRRRGELLDVPEALPLNPVARRRPRRQEARRDRANEDTMPPRARRRGAL